MEVQQLEGNLREPCHKKIHQGKDPSQSLLRAQLGKNTESGSTLTISVRDVSDILIILGSAQSTGIPWNPSTTACTKVRLSGSSPVVFSVVIHFNHLSMRFAGGKTRYRQIPGTHLMNSVDVRKISTTLHFHLYSAHFYFQKTIFPAHSNPKRSKRWSVVSKQCCIENYSTALTASSNYNAFPILLSDCLFELVLPITFCHDSSAAELVSLKRCTFNHTWLNTSPAVQDATFRVVSPHCGPRCPL